MIIVTIYDSCNDNYFNKGNYNNYFDDNNKNGSNNHNNYSDKDDDHNYSNNDNHNNNDYYHYYHYNYSYHNTFATVATAAVIDTLTLKYWTFSTPLHSLVPNILYFSLFSITLYSVFDILCLISHVSEFFLVLIIPYHALITDHILINSVQK